MRLINRFTGVICLALSLVVMTSCGEDSGGGGGGGGSGESGVYLDVMELEPIDNATDEDTANVDIVRTADCDGDSETVDPEIFSGHNANATFAATLIAGVDDEDDESQVVAEFVEIFSYTVEYTLVSGTGPAFPDTTYFESITVLTDGNTFEGFLVNLMPLDLKAAFEISLGGSGWPYSYPVYSLTYTFYAEDEYGNDLWTRAFTTVTVGDFDNCTT